MASGNIAKHRASKTSQRKKGAHRAKSRKPPPHRWLGAGVLSVGVGAALASGSGLAHADDNSNGGNSSSNGHASGRPPLSRSARPTAGNSSSDTPKASSIGKFGPTRSSNPHSSAAAAGTGTADSAGAGSNVNRGGPRSAADAGKSTKQDAASQMVPPSAAAALTGARPTDGIGGTSDQVVSVTTASAVTSSGPTAGAGSTGETTVLRSGLAGRAPGAPAAMTRGSALAVHPVMGLLVGVLSALGLNTPTAPTHPLGALVWGLFRGVESGFGLVPTAGVPDVGTPDPTTGAVTVVLGFTEAAGLPMAYAVTTQPTMGSVVVDSTGTCIYTPTTDARQAVGATTSQVTDTFTVTATDGVAATNETVTVPVLPLGQVTPPHGVLFFDDFLGSTLDPKKWTVGNWDEGLVYYSPDNVTVSNGVLTLTADATYHSGKVQTIGNFGAGINTVWEARIKFPTPIEPGLWPAFWMLPMNYPTFQDEVDIVELFGNGVWNDVTTVHDNHTGTDTYATYLLPPAATDGGWHTWRMEWTTAGMSFYVDYVDSTSQPYATVPAYSIGNWHFNDPGMQMSILMNLAVGGSGGGDVTNTEFPADMQVDWVKVTSLN